MTTQVIHLLQFILEVTDFGASVRLAVDHSTSVLLFEKRKSDLTGTEMAELASLFVAPRLAYAPSPVMVVHEVGLPERTDDPAVVEAMGRAVTAHLGRFGWRAA